ncbi:MAG: SOS response-associated peptidase [Bacteroidetes bacterium]|nr:MAG: SOS response-associated peptidase [Bacteroidota bacterium]
MCFDIKFVIASQLKREKRLHDLKPGDTGTTDLQTKHPEIKDLFHASAFTHPRILIYTNREPYKAIPSVWGLIPSWVKDNRQKLQLWNKTLNARGETIFEKPSFRYAAKHNRCLIYLDGFYEHHHYKGKAYPFFIHRKDNGLLPIAGLWSEWTDKDTGEMMNSFTIVTTKGNGLMAKIHNNPKLSEPRMPVILPDNEEDIWLNPLLNKDGSEKIKDLIKPYPDECLTAHTVRKLRGKDAIGNLQGASDIFSYNNLIF